MGALTSPTLEGTLTTRKFIFIMAMICEQLLLFPETEEQRQSREIAELKGQIHKLRKSLFARHTELERLYNELYEEVQEIKNG